MSRYSKYGGLHPAIKERLQEKLQSNEEEIVEGLAKYLLDEWQDLRGGPSNQFQALEKAKSILGNEPLSHIAPKIENTSNISRAGVIRDAISKGHLRQLKIDEPWDPDAFLEGEMNTFPLHHREAIVYTGVNVKEFFKKAAKQGDTIAVKESSLNLRYLPAQSTSNQGKTADLENPGRKGPYTYTGFLATARWFAKRPDLGCVVKLRVPTSILHVNLSRTFENYDFNSERKAGSRTISKLSVLHNAYASETGNTGNRTEEAVEIFREECRQVSKTKPDDEVPREHVQFIVTSQVELDRVIGVWDIHYFDQPHFESLKGYVTNLKGRYPDKLPEGVETNKARARVEEELERLETLEKLLKELENALEGEIRGSTPMGAAELIEKIQSEKTDLGTELWLLDYRIEGQDDKYGKEGYEHVLNRLKQFYRKNFNKELEYQNSVQSLKELHDRMPQIMEYIEESIKIIEEDIQTEKERHKEQNWSTEKFKKEIRYEEKIEQQIYNRIKQLPHLQPVLKQVNKLNKKYA